MWAFKDACWALLFCLSVPPGGDELKFSVSDLFIKVFQKMSTKTLRTMVLCWADSEVFRLTINVLLWFWKCIKTVGRLPRESVFPVATIQRFWYIFKIITSLGSVFTSYPGCHRKKNFGPEIHPDRNGNVMVGPEKWFNQKLEI